MIDFLASTYRVRANDRAPFGEHWCGPADAFAYGEWVTVARYHRDEDGDGYNVEVDCCAMPARFYRVRATVSPDGTGAMRPGFTLSTGSGMAEWCATTAEHIAAGMVGVPSGEGE